MKIQKLKLPETTNKVALVSVAHADDLLLFCGGGVAALTEPETFTSPPAYLK